MLTVDFCFARRAEAMLSAAERPNEQQRKVRSLSVGVPFFVMVYRYFEDMYSNICISNYNLSELIFAEPPRPSKINSLFFSFSRNATEVQSDEIWKTVRNEAYPETLQSYRRTTKTFFVTLL